MKKSFKRSATNILCSSAFALLGAVPMAAQACPEVSSVYIGSVCTVAFTFCPDGYLAAQGQELPVNNYQALYSLISNIYGGNGSTLFNLPDLRGRVVAGVNPSVLPGISPLPLGTKNGAESTVLVTAQVPPHVHPAAVNTTGSPAGTLNLGLNGATVTGQTVGGSLAVNAITTATTGASGTPSSSNNTIGRVGTGTAAYYPYDSTKAVAVPVTSNLTVSGGTVSGVASTATATVTVGPSAAASQAVPTIPPRIALTACIAYQGIYPVRP